MHLCVYVCMFVYTCMYVLSVQLSVSGGWDVYVKWGNMEQKAMSNQDWKVPGYVT